MRRLSATDVSLAGGVLGIRIDSPKCNVILPAFKLYLDVAQVPSK